MANEKKPKKAAKESGATETEGILETTAKAIGTAAGKIASLAGVEPAPAPPQTKSMKPEKLQKKNKSRLPRRQKKAEKKAAMAKAK